MSSKYLLLAVLLASGCVAAESTSSDARLVQVMVTSQGKHSFERLVTAAQPLASEACAKDGKGAEWAVANTLSASQLRLGFVCK